jgi:transcription-repair coupling factor (superfamily II helicase)
MLASPLSKILLAARELSGPIRVAGLLGSSRAWFILRCLEHTRRPIVVVAPDEDHALALLQDCDALAAPALGEAARTFLVPGWEQPAHSCVIPSLRVRMLRAAALAELISIRRGTTAGALPPIFFSSPAGLLLRTAAPADWSAHVISLNVGDSPGSRDTLLARLLFAGYLKGDSVDDPGTFALRGEILDVYPPGAEFPYRVEFFDDSVEKIRAFDPKTQLTLTSNAERSSLLIVPCRETLLTPETRPRVRDRLKQLADDLGLPRAVRDPILETLALGGYADHSEFWPAYASSEPATVLDYLPEDALIIQWDDLGCDQAWDLLWREECDGYSRAAEHSFIVPPPAELYASDQLDELRRRRAFVLQSVVLTEAGDAPTEEPTSDGPSRDHRVQVRSNEDLQGLSPQARLEQLVSKLREWQARGFKVLLGCPTLGQADRLAHLLSGRGIALIREKSPAAGEISIQVSSLTSGFRWASEGWVILSEQEALGESAGRSRRPSRRKESAATEWAGIEALSDLSAGDAVVHQEHGIGRYQGIVRLDGGPGSSSDFLLIEYAGGDKLYLPVYRMNLIQKHSASASSVALDRLGSAQFLKTKARVKESVRKLAIDLVQLYAERSLRSGFCYSGRDAALEEFESRFPYEETPDQAAAIDAVIEDLRQGKVMDRLVCGDVGYGKTEVAIRAAFRVATDGKQVAVLVPTTLLAHQHEQSFRSRMAGLPIIVESLSRFKTAKEQKDVLRRTKEGKVDVLIGTHRLLSKDVAFKDLGLLVIDEEHRFGVEHKEKIKALKTNVPVLTLTATPIPRTLHMALSGLREISLIRTPPVDRLPIRTFVSKQEDSIIKRAIDFELSRGGQVFFLYNRVQSIFETAKRIQDLCPAARVSVAHGQMAEGALEEAVRDFYERRSNVLVCTSIIESGIDLPSANTILIHRADAFGLAQLYQIRGRVGRGHQRGYAYLLIPGDLTLSDDAKKRLDVIQRFVELGSGFSVASHDLDIRGGGDLLGPQQSGHILAVGFDTYLSLLEEAIQEIRAGIGQNQESAPAPEPEIKCPFSSYLADTYVPDLHHRLSLYRRLSGCSSDAAVDALEAELVDRFGPPPEEATNLLWLIRVKVSLKRLKIDAITVGPERLVLSPGAASLLEPARAIALVAGHPKKYSLTPESRFVARAAVRSVKELYFAIQDLLDALSPAQSVAKPTGGG